MFILFQRIWEENSSFSFNLFCFPFLYSFLKTLTKTFCVICVADYICIRNAFQDIFCISWRYYNTVYVIKPKQIVLLYPLPWPLIISGKTTEVFYFTGGVISKCENNVLSACLIRSPYKNIKCVDFTAKSSVCSSCQWRYFSWSNLQQHKQRLPSCGQHTTHFWDNYVLNIIRVAVDLQIMSGFFSPFFPLKNISEQIWCTCRKMFWIYWIYLENNHTTKSQENMYSCIRSMSVRIQEV